MCLSYSPPLSSESSLAVAGSPLLALAPHAFALARGRPRFPAKLRTDPKPYVSEASIRKDGSRLCGVGHGDRDGQHNQIQSKSLVPSFLRISYFMWEETRDLCEYCLFLLRIKLEGNVLIYLRQLWQLLARIFNQV